jgi:hypothetical protein
MSTREPAYRAYTIGFRRTSVSNMGTRAISPILTSYEEDKLLANYHDLQRDHLEGVPMNTVRRVHVLQPSTTSWARTGEYDGTKERSVLHNKLDRKEQKEYSRSYKECPVSTHEKRPFRD